MNAYILLAVATFALSTESVVAKECDLASIGSTGSANEVLSRRAIAIVREAGGNGWRGNAQLQASLTTNATFSLGAGDVLRPLGTGIAGAHAFALAMNATRYRFCGYDYMDIPGRGGCSDFKVQVEFSNDKLHSASMIAFTFKNGRLISAVGWQRSLVEGSLNENH